MLQHCCTGPSPHNFLRLLQPSGPRTRLSAVKQIPKVKTRTAPTRVCAFQSDIKPAYNKYRSRSDIEKSYIQQWKQTTARDGKIKPQTVWSTLWFIPIWVKYHVVPDIVRYAWYIVWSALRALYMEHHRWAVLQGAKADIWLAQKGGNPVQTFSRSMVMRRFHFKVGRWENLKYRYRLLTGQPV